MLPGDLDAEEESLYRRRQKNIDVRRSRFPHRIRRILGWMLLGGVTLVPLGYGGIHLAAYALRSPHFQVSGSQDVIIEGSRFASREEVLSALGLPLYWTAGEGVNVFRLNLDEGRKQVESIPWVRSASVTRVFPNRLVVQITERVPVAFANIGGRVKLIDAEGVLLEKPEKCDFTFPVLGGLDESVNPGDRLVRLALYQEFMQQLSAEGPSSGWLISEVDLQDADDLRAMLVQGRETIEVHFGRNNFLDRFREFLTLLPEMRKADANIDSVDLRYRNQVVVNPQKSTDVGQTKDEK
jgi:cell division protein FtsQ